MILKAGTDNQDRSNRCQFIDQRFIKVQVRLVSCTILTNLCCRTYGEVPGYHAKIGMGIVSGAVGSFVGNPAEVALIRMTADGRLPPEKRRNYKNVFNALRR